MGLVDPSRHHQGALDDPWLDTTTPHGEWIAGQRRKIAERYAAGETMRELAIDYEVGEATIWRALRG
jgi:hypothetical protein